MPRILEAVESPGNRDDDNGATSAARSIALAVTMLLVSFLVLGRSHAALSAADASTRLESGTVELTDDDDGRALFDFRDLAPGHPVANCITVTYRGSIFDLEVGLRVRGSGGLAPYLLTTVELGTGGGYGSCNGFSPTETLYDGTLADLQARHGSSSPALPTFVARQTPDSRTFRITFEVQDTVDAQGLLASTDFLWTAAT